MGEVIGLVFLGFVVPLALVLHYVTKWKTVKGLSNEDETMLEDLWESAKRMEQRINALETILDAEVEDWRKRSDRDGSHKRSEMPDLEEWRKRSESKNWRNGS